MARKAAATQLQATEMAALLAACGRGEKSAFVRLHKLALPRLMRNARRLTAGHELAEDVIQESFIAIWRQSSQYDPLRAAPMTWMSTIVRHKAYDAFRAGQLRFRASEEDIDASQAEDAGMRTPCEFIEVSQRSAEIARCMGRLDQGRRNAIELAFLQDLTHEEVAIRMGKPLGTIKTWIRRGVIDLRRQMVNPTRSTRAAVW